MSTRLPAWVVHELPLGAAVLSQSVGALVIGGWLLDIPVLKQISPELPPMRFNAALGFFVIGVCLFFAAQPATPRFPRVVRAGIGFVIVLALATWLQGVLGVDFGIDELFVQDDSSTGLPGRMSWVCAVGLLLSGVAMSTCRSERPLRRGVAGVCSLAVLTIAFVPLAGYVFGTAHLSDIGVGTVPVHSAVTLVALGLGLLPLVNEGRDRNASAVLWEPTGAALQVRWILVTVFAIPLLVGVAVVSEALLRDLDRTIAIAVLASVVAASVVVTVVAAALHPFQARLALKERALAASHDGVVITRHDAHEHPIMYVNDAFLRITGYSREECYGRDWRFLGGAVPGQEQEQARAAIRHALDRGEALTITLQNARKDGTLFWNRLSLSPIRDRRTARTARRQGCAVTHYIGIVEDVSEEQRVEAELRGLYEQVKEARDALQELNAQKDTLVNVVSHELRSPLNAALTWVSLAQIDPSERNVTRALQVVEQSIATQTRLIDDLVQATRSSQPELSLKSEPIELSEIVRSVVQEALPTVEAPLSIEIEDATHASAWIYGDRERLQQVFRNLLANAVNYSGDGGAIRVHVGAGDGSLEVAVSDEGVGIASEHISDVFRPFWRANTRIKGVGLGLSIVKSLVERHGGSVQVQSEGIGRGTTIRVILPRLESEETADTLQ